MRFGCVLCISLHFVLCFVDWDEFGCTWLALRVAMMAYCFDCVCRAGNLVALSGMTGMQTLDLSNNQLTGAFRFCDFFHCIPCCDLSTGASSGVSFLRFVWQ